MWKKRVCFDGIASETMFFDCYENCKDSSLTTTYLFVSCYDTHIHMHIHTNTHTYPHFEHGHNCNYPASVRSQLLLLFLSFV